jgi:hypothetical protein
VTGAANPTHPVMPDSVPASWDEVPCTLKGCLATELFTRLGAVNESGAYQGPKYFTFNGTLLSDLAAVGPNQEDSAAHR